MIKRFVNVFNNRRKTISSFSYLSLFQIFTILSPLITYPYLIRVLGIELYGHVLFAQSVMSYLSIWVEFGLRNLGVKYIAECNGDKLAISNVLCSIIQARVFLYIIGVLIVIFILWLIPELNEFKLLYLFSTGIALNAIFFPEFYFLGVEEIKYITVINLLIRIIFIFLLFVLIKIPSDYLLVPLLNTVGIVAGGLVSFYVIFVKHRIPFKIQTVKHTFSYFKKSFFLFLSDAVISVKDRFTVVFIGIFVGMGEVPVYDLGMKIIIALSKPFEILNTIILPEMSQRKDIDFLKKSIKLICLFTLGLSLLIFALLPQVTTFFIGDNVYLLPLQLMLLIPSILSVSYTVATNYFIVFEHNKLLLLGMILTTLFYLVLVAAGWWLSLLDGMLSFVIVSVLVYLFEMIYRCYMFKRIQIVSRYEIYK